MHADEGPAWTLSSTEHAAAAAKCMGNRLSFALLLKYFGINARFPRSFADLDRAAILYLAKQLNVTVAIRSESFELDRTIKRYRAKIRAFFGFRGPTVRDADALTRWLCDHVVVDSRDREQITEALGLECRRRMLEPPARDRMDRIVRATVLAYEERVYHDTFASLSLLSRTR